MSQTEVSIGIIGAGRLAKCLVAGLIARDYPPARIALSNPSAAKLDALKEQYCVNVTSSNTELARMADIIVLCVKPNKMHSVLSDIELICRERKPLILSVAAGISCDSIQTAIGVEAPLVRCMPNIAAKCAASATALFAANGVNAAERDLAERLFTTIGTVTWMSEERHIDVATAIAGSGSAYFIFVLEAMQKAAAALDLPEDMANALIRQTLLGVGQLIEGEMHDLKSLRETVTSKGGTTEAALTVLKERDLTDIFYEAIRAAYQRAEALSTGE